MTASMPSLHAISTQSANGKNASEAMTAPFRSKSNDFAFSMACLSASTRDVCPMPLAQSCLPLARTMALLLLCLTILLAKSRSSACSGVMAFCVACFKSSVDSLCKSLSCFSMPFRMERYCTAGNAVGFWIRMILFFFCSRIARASDE